MRGITPVLCAAAVVASGSAAFAQSNDEILRRLDRLERENAALRQEVHAMRAGQHVEPAGRRAHVIEALPTYKRLEVTYAAPEAVPFNWAGAHVGVFGGGTLLTPSGSGTTVDVGRVDVHQNALTGPYVIGGLVGGSAGYDWQRGALVYGVEGDFAHVFADKFHEAPAEHFVQGMLQGVVSNDYRMDAFATLRAKAGIAVDRGLIYGTVGVGAIHGQQTASVGIPVVYLTKSQWVPALAIGGGVDYAIWDHWTIGAEALYLAAAQMTQDIPDSFLGRRTYRISPSQAVVKASVSYKF